MKLTLELSEAQERQLAEVAARLNIPAEQLASAVLRDFVTQPGGSVDLTAWMVLEKNEELYKRLAE